AWPAWTITRRCRQRPRATQSGCRKLTWPSAVRGGCRRRWTRRSARSRHATCSGTRWVSRCSRRSSRCGGAGWRSLPRRAPRAVVTAMAPSAASDADVTVAERLQLKLAELTPAERKVARALMAEYPVRGLQPVAKLAAAAGVSAPTVVRLVSKLSFESYAGFQQSLKSEVSARLWSPLTMHADRSAADGDAL